MWFFCSIRFLLLLSCENFSLWVCLSAVQWKITYSQSRQHTTQPARYWDGCTSPSNYTIDLNCLALACEQSELLVQWVHVNFKLSPLSKGGLAIVWSRSARSGSPATPSAWLRRGREAFVAKSRKQLIYSEFIAKCEWEGFNVTLSLRVSLSAGENYSNCLRMSTNFSLCWVLIEKNCTNFALLTYLF